MDKKKKKQKLRATFRKNRAGRVRQTDWTDAYQADDEQAEDRVVPVERIGKGEHTRKRTVVGYQADEGTELGQEVVPEVEDKHVLTGRVLSVHGLMSMVQGPDGQVYRCVTRGLLRTLATEQRTAVVTGDVVTFRTSGPQQGLIERVEPRHGVLSRSSRGRQHVIAANVDQMLIVASAAEPRLKPHLIDRLLVSAESSRIRPVICINKIDLVEAWELEPLVGVYSQMGYEVLLLSAQTGRGIDRLRRVVRGQQNVVVGQSGVGKTSLLNALEPGLSLRVGTVSAETQKGKHTTTSARLVPMSEGGYLVDTPGIRQFQLWDIVPEEAVGWFRDLRVFVDRCRFPDCTHTHEADCGVKDAVADDLLDARRYESYCGILLGTEEEKEKE